ncbi:MAG: hypothetical protein GWN07_29595, partial [Actinobacteria bacterium]|nr:hypothetical protein [Actinomycetota bacterium]NIX23753.1 hypothetical protein [Actinomycetota bacterium]
WQLPETLPPTASVYVCDIGVVAAGSTDQLTFEVVKNPDSSADDDLTFRADVIGEITLSNADANGNQALWFPTPTLRSPEDGLLDLANDYTLDALRARVVGYNLTKDQLGTCTENNPPPGDPDDEVQIGEECSFHIESGGWFGFETPGYDYIAVRDIAVDDEIPDGQGYISQQDPDVTDQILNVQLTPGGEPAPVSEGTFGWTFNTVDPDERITEKDHWFRVDTTTRLLNDPVDSSA